MFLNYPNNPTGAAATRPQLEAWVNYALANRAIILFDAAYEAYIADPALPHSIYEIPGARECAIEFRSFSKHGGFTGTRCAFTVLPRTLRAASKTGELHPLHPLWLRRMTTKFNGVSYIVQRALEERLSILYRQGKILGGVYLSTGQEAVTVGFCHACGGTTGSSRSTGTWGPTSSRGTPGSITIYPRTALNPRRTSFSRTLSTRLRSGKTSCLPAWTISSTGAFFT
jgi:hypothetical protein